MNDTSRGGVRFEIAGPLMSPLNCHCSQCRRQHGAAFRSRVRVKAEDFRWLQGEDLARQAAAGRPDLSVRLGLIPSTKADDGDPLDVLIIHDAATYPGLVLKCKPIGVLDVEQAANGKKERNDRVFVVPDRSPFEGDLQDINQLPPRAIDELEKFFQATNALEAKTLRFLGWGGREKAIKRINSAMR